MTTMNKRLPTLVLLLIFCWNVEAQNGLRGKRELATLEIMPEVRQPEQPQRPEQQQQQQPQEEEAGPAPKTNKHDGLLGCIEENLRQVPESEHTRFQMAGCRPNLSGIFISQLGIGENKTDAEALQELLRCVGDHVGCPDPLGEPDPRQPDPYADLLQCFDDGLNGVPGAITFRMDAFNCVSGEESTLETMVTCIGTSIGCPVPEGGYPNNTAIIAVIPAEDEDNVELGLDPVQVQPEVPTTSLARAGLDAFDNAP